ncbi:fatty acid desaturase family protein [Pseudomonas sp. MPB03]|uniref:fatty acid desaturase family protein n=1 Tax=Pseudomonas sp. MPB03 TaxID=3388489 RepID=UPI0039852D99
MDQDLDALNKKAVATAREYTTELAWPTMALVLLVWASLIGDFYLFATGQLSLPTATLVYAVVTYMSYTPLHEAVHGNIHGAHHRLQWLNDLCGYLVAPLMMVPFSTHKVEHFTHHRFTNQPDKDPDYVVNGMSGGFLAFLACGFRFLWVQNTFLFRDYWPTAPRRVKATYIAEVLFAIGWRAALIALIEREHTWVLLVFGYLAGGYFVAYWFAYRPHVPYQESTRYRNTNSLIMPGWIKPLEWFWLGQNLHSVHHLFPRVPFYRYHALHRRIEPIMRAHGTPMIGAFSRRNVDAARRPE